MAEPLVLINSFEVPDGQAGQFIAAWEKTRDYLAAQPGYVDTALHQSVTPGAGFQFVNIARWQTTEDFQRAMQSTGSGSQQRAWLSTARIPACTASCEPDRLLVRAGARIPGPGTYRYANVPVCTGRPTGRPCTGPAGWRLRDYLAGRPPDRLRKSDVFAFCVTISACSTASRPAVMASRGIVSWLAGKPRRS